MPRIRRVKWPRISCTAHNRYLRLEQTYNRASDPLDDDVRNMLFYTRGKQLLGYCKYSVYDDMVYIDWFVAPKNGKTVFKRALKFLEGYRRPMVCLFVSSEDSPKAFRARVSLYSRFGFKPYLCKDSTASMLDSLKSNYMFKPNNTV